MSQLTSGQHQSHDLMLAAQKWADLPRFYPSPQSQPITWRAYADDVLSLAGYLTLQGVPPSTKMAILGQTSYAWCVAYSAIQSVRGIVVPIYPASPAESIQYFLDHSDTKILFCDSHFLSVLAPLDLQQLQQVILLDKVNTSDLSVPVLSLTHALTQGQPHQPAAMDILTTASSKDLATIIYTSGTTGLPKGVMLDHANLQSSAADWIALNGPHMPPHAVDLHWLPLAHAFGIGAIMLGNRLGWETWLTNPKDVLSLLPTVKPHLFLSVPAYWEKIYGLMQQAGGVDMKTNFATVTGGRLTFGLSGGAGLKKEIKEGFYQVGLLLIEGYGLTECSPTLTMNRRDHFNFDSVGVPYPSVQIQLAEDGEILAKGPNIFKGYYKNDTATQEAFTADGWFKTGDVGRWLEGGFLQIIDRKKEILVTSGGKNIPPQNIERQFQDNPYIEHLVVYGDGKKYLTALVTLHPQPVRDALNEPDLPWADLLATEPLQQMVKAQIQQVNARLASYETIKKYWICPQPLTVEDHLLTSSFKIRRKAIYEKYGSRMDLLYDS